MSTLLLVQSVKANGRIIPAGKTVTLEDEKTITDMIAQGIAVELPSANPMSEGRRETLREVSQAILDQACADLQSGGTWVVTPEVTALEVEIARVHELLLEGGASLAEFKDVVGRWMATGSQGRVAHNHHDVDESEAIAEHVAEIKARYRHGEPPAKRAVWSKDMLELVNWFNLAELPGKPFDLSQNERVCDPVRYYETLRREIEAGPATTRAKYGTLAADLRRLKAYMEKRN